MITTEKNNLPTLPNERRKKYEEKGITPINIDKIISNKDISDFLEKLIDKDIDFKIASNILTGDILSYLNKNNLKLNETKLTTNNFISVVKALSKDEISSKIFKEILKTLMEDNSDITTTLENNKQTSSKEEVNKIINEVLSKYPDSVKDYKSGKENAVKFLMGMVMKESKGKIKPKIAMDVLKDNLNK